MPIPIPGVKLGLANIVTVYVMFVLGPGDALLVLSARVFLGAVFSGQMSTLLYSAGGGLLCWLALCLLRRVLSRDQIWLCSPVAAIFHNLGQLLVAAGVMKTWAVLAYLPYLVMAGAAARSVYRPMCPGAHPTFGENTLKNSRHNVSGVFYKVNPLDWAVR